MKRVFALLVMFSVMLSGCGIFSDSYVSVTPHRIPPAGWRTK